MADRAHRTALDNLKSFRERQAAKRDQLQAELAAAEPIYKEWLNPKTNYEKALNAKRAFDSHSQALSREVEGQVIAAADPRIRAALDHLARQREDLSLACSVEGARRNHGRPSNTAAHDACVKAIKVATDELTALFFVECDDVPAAIRKILAKIPGALNLEPA